MDNGKKDATAGSRKLFVVRFYLIIALTFFMGVGSVAEGKSTNTKISVPKGENHIYVSPDKGLDRKGENHIYVSPDKGKDRYDGLTPSRAKATIMKALDEVKKKCYPDQWSIVLLEGTHLVHQAVRVDSDATIVGVDMNKTIIDAGGKARIFNLCNYASLTLKNLTLKNGYQKEDGKPADGGAIFSTSIFYLSIDHCIFSKNKARRGGAIFCSNTAVDITDSYFTGNWALQDGGAIFLTDKDCWSNIINCSFRKNHAGSVLDGVGGAVRAFKVYSFFLSKNKFRENEATYGGAIALTGVSIIKIPQIRDCEFEENRARYDGGAILSTNQYDICVMDCTYYGNTAACHGGAIFNGDESDLRVINNTFNNNSAWNLGGAVYNGFHLKTEGSAFTGNQADEGGAICNKGNYLMIERSSFAKNEACFVFGDAWGMSDEYDKSDHSGGALYNADEAKAKVIECEFSANRAGRGGALANGGGGRVVIKRSAFTENRANQGGAVCNKGETTIEACMLTRNEARVVRDNLGLSDHSGGALCNIDKGTATVSGCEFSANRAGRGGALANEGGGSTVVTESAFTENTADNGDILYAQSAETEMNFNRIMGKGIEDIFCEDSVVYADRNWWGSNADPRERIRGNVFFDPWVVLSVKAEHSDIHDGDASVITADLLHDSDGVYHDPAQGCIPDGLVTLAVPWGSFDNDSIIHSETRQAVNGRVAATFHANEGSTPLPLDLIRVTAMTDGYETTDVESAYVTINRADPPM